MTARATAARPHHRSRVDGPLATAAVAATAAFAGGGLLTQVVLVPLWRATGQQTIAATGPAVGSVLFPLEVASVVMLAAAAYRCRRVRGRSFWFAALACMAGTFVLLPLYFAEANTALLEGALSAQGVAAELRSWNAWNWGRTGLALAAVVLGCAATAFDRAAVPGPEPTPPAR